MVGGESGGRGRSGGEGVEERGEIEGVEGKGEGGGGKGRRVSRGCGGGGVGAYRGGEMIIGDREFGKIEERERRCARWKRQREERVQGGWEKGQRVTQRRRERERERQRV